VPFGDKIARGMTSIAAPTDIVPGTRDIALGENWFPLESYRGQSFRWADNDAVIHAATLDSVQSVLRFVVEPGPGMGQKPLEISVRLSDGTELRKATVTSKQAVTIDLPPESPRVFSLVLHAEGGGKASFNDPRTLNFRVFEITLERRSDVFPAWAKPAQNFYPLEHHAGQHFRWVSNDATVELHGVHGGELRFDVESGPGLESKPFTLDIKTPDGTSIASARVGERTTVTVPLGAVAGASVLTLHVEGGGKPLKTDPRVLNFRVFACES
jgi:hypothetical protein